MNRHLVASLVVGLWGGFAFSCGSPESNGTDGTSGDAGVSGAAGPPSGSGGAATASTGGAPSAGAGGVPVAGNGGAAAAGRGGADPQAGGGRAPAAGSGGQAAAGTASLGGSGGAETEDHWGGLKNPPVKSAGCGKPAALTSGKKTIRSGGQNRAYIIDVPTNYDVNKAYRLFYASHGLGGTAEDVAGWSYFDLKKEAASANDPAVFIAPQGIDGRWGEADHALFDDITTLVKEGLCIDTTRVFVTGMSFGGMITYSLSTNHQKRFRAGVALAPANYNIWLPNPKQKDPIAWMHTTGMGDNTCP